MASLWPAASGCDDASTEPAPPATAPAVAPLALTPVQYNNTIADLFGLPRDGARWPARPSVADVVSPLPSTTSIFGVKGGLQQPWPWDFPAEPGADGFSGIAQGQQPSAAQVERIHKAALHYGAYALVAPYFFACDALAGATLSAKQSPYAAFAKLSDTAQRDCAWQSIERFVQRAYRRPIAAAERTRLRAFWTRNDAAEPRDVAIALTVAGILQAPGFIYRVEKGAPPRTDDDADGSTAPLTGWELASRLSYFLWGSMPDTQLFAAAEAGKLATSEAIEAQARRMLADPKARAAVVRFHRQWLGTDKVLRVSPARRVFAPLFGVAPEPKRDTTDDGLWPAIIGPVRYSMYFEADLFYERTIFDGAGTFTALLTDNHGYASAVTAPIYGADAQRIAGLPSVTRRYELISASLKNVRDLSLYPVTFPRAKRAGVLTLPAVLAVGAHPVQPAPILRGTHVLERVLCMNVGVPTSGAESAQPPDTISAKSTNRERTHQATAAPSCATCHKVINPPGFAFEHYDAIGAWRAQDNGQTVDASGTLTLPGAETIPFKDGIDLATKLAASKSARDCYVLRWTRAALGNQLTMDAPGLEPLMAAFRQNDKVQDLLVAIAKSELFRNRRVEVRQ